MQIILPGQHPMYGAIILLFLMAIGLIGITLLFIGIRLIIKKSKKKILKYTLTSIGGLITVFVLFNWINYHLIHASYENEFIGKYTNNETGYEFILKSDNTWSSNYEGLECDNGNWEFTITEDMSYLELEASCGEYLHVQIYNYDESFIEFGVDQNTSNNESVLRYLKEN